MKPTWLSCSHITLELKRLMLKATLLVASGLISPRIHSVASCENTQLGPQLRISSGR